MIFVLMRFKQFANHRRACSARQWAKRDSGKLARLRGDSRWMRPGGKFWSSLHFAKLRIPRRFWNRLRRGSLYMRDRSDKTTTLSAISQETNVSRLLLSLKAGARPQPHAASHCSFRSMVESGGRESATDRCHSVLVKPGSPGAQVRGRGTLERNRRSRRTKLAESERLREGMMDRHLTEMNNDDCLKWSRWIFTPRRLE